MGTLNKLKQWRNRLISNDSANYQRDILAMGLLTPLNRSYLPWTGSSMRPSAMVTILNDITINRRRTVLECGSGISTFYIARLLAETSGHLYTIDHDADWSTLLVDMLKREGLDGVVTVVHAPMQECSHALEGNQWYSTQSIEDGLDDAKIELLIVDGPLAYTRQRRLARYPAVPFFAPRLADDCTIILDDIDRKGEQIIARRWSQLLEVPFVLRKLDGGIAIGRRGQRFHL